MIWLVAGVAHAGASFGVGAGVAADLPDKGGYAKFGVGPTLDLPFAIDLSTNARFRATLSAGESAGGDRLSWTEQVDGQDVRLYDTDHEAWLMSGSLSVGADVFLPLHGKTRPYLGSEVGLAWFGAYHSGLGAGKPTDALMDPTQNQLDDPHNVDPYTNQLAPLTEVHLGLQQDLSDKVALWIEPGYAVAYLGAAPLRKTPSDIDARRDAFGWNAARLGVGVRFAL